MAEKFVCQRPDYFVTCQAAEEKVSNGDSAVIRLKNLEIGRLNFGKIRFLSCVQLQNGNMDDIVFINHKEVILYPEKNFPSKPPVGEGLNCPAEVTLERVWPTRQKNWFDKAFEARLIKACEEQDAEFVSYCKESGLLKFRVKHFSKYSCHIEEDEDENGEDQVRTSNTPGTNNPPTHRVQIGLGGISLEEFNKQQQRGTKKLPVHNNPDNPDQAHHQCPPDPYELPASGTGAYVGSGDGPSTPSTGKVGQDFGDNNCAIIDEPMDTSTPVFNIMERRIKIATGQTSTTLYEPTPPSSSIKNQSLRLRPYKPVLKSSGSLRSEMLKSMIIQEQLSDNFVNEELLQSTYPTPPKKWKAPSCPLESERSSLSTCAQTTSSSPFASMPSFLNVQKPSGGTAEYSNAPLPNTSIPFNVQAKVEFSSKANCTDLFSSINSVKNAPQFKLHGAPRVCFTRSGHIVTIENQKTSTEGFKGQAKVSVIRSYSEKQETYPLSDSYRDTIQSELMLLLKTGREVLFKENAEIVKEQLSKYNFPTCQQQLQSELVIWQLCEILWPEQVSNQATEVNDDGFLLIQRRKLSEWLVENGSFIFGPAYNDEDKSIFGLLKKGKLEEACEKAMSDGHPMLALVLANNQSSIFDLKNLKEVIKFCPEQYSDILALCSGSLLGLEKLTVDTVSNMWSYDWLQYFALYLWYCCDSCNNNMAVDHAVRNFEGMIRKIVGDNEAPLPKYACSSAATMCVHLLKLYSCTGYPVKKLLCPQTGSSDQLDYKLSWLLMMNLETMGYIPENDVYSNVCVAFAGQLEEIKMFEWAVFVAKCHFPPEDDDVQFLEKATLARNLHEKRLLERHIENGAENDSLEKEMFLINHLGVDEKSIFRIKAERASVSQRYDQMIGYFRRSGDYQKAFNVLKQYLDAHGVDVIGHISDEYPQNVLKHLVTLYPFRKSMVGWDVHGKIMVNFFKLLQVEKFLTTTPSTSGSRISHQDYVESALLGFIRAIVKYEPENERQRAFLLELTILAQKKIELMLIDEKVEESTKDKIKEALVSFLNISVPKDYFEGIKGFINNMLLTNN